MSAATGAAMALRRIRFDGSPFDAAIVKEPFGPLDSALTNPTFALAVHQPLRGNARGLPFLLLGLPDPLLPFDLPLVREVVRQELSEVTHNRGQTDRTDELAPLRFDQVDRTHLGWQNTMGRLLRL